MKRVVVVVEVGEEAILSREKLQYYADQLFRFNPMIKVIGINEVDQSFAKFLMPEDKKATMTDVQAKQYADEAMTAASRADGKALLAREAADRAEAAAQMAKECLDQMESIRCTDTSHEPRCLDMVQKLHKIKDEMNQVIKDLNHDPDINIHVEIIEMKSEGNPPRLVCLEFSVSKEIMP